MGMSIHRRLPGLLTLKNPMLMRVEETQGTGLYPLSGGVSKMFQCKVSAHPVIEVQHYTIPFSIFWYFAQPTYPPCHNDMFGPIYMGLDFAGAPMG